MMVVTHVLTAPAMHHSDPVPQIVLDTG